MALSEATKDALYMGGLLGDLGLILDNVIIKNDNIGAQRLATIPIHHARTKHIDIRHHFVRLLEKGLIQHVLSFSTCLLIIW